MSGARLLLATLVLCLGAAPVQADENAQPLDAIAGSFRYLVENDLWDWNSTMRSPDYVRPAFEMDGGTLPRGLAAVMISEGKLGETDPVIEVWAYAFDTAENARAYAKVYTRKEREVASQLEVRHEYEAFERREGGAGHFSRRVRATQRGRLTRDEHVFQHGRFVTMLSVHDDMLARKAQDAAVARAIEAMRDPVAAAKRRDPPAPSLGPAWRVLTVRVLDPEGKPVPRAHVASIVRAGKPGARTAYTHCWDGECRLAVRHEAAGAIYVWQPRTPEGTPLPFAASLENEFAAHTRDVQVRLAGGRRIAGLVLDGEGEPVPGVTVRARLDLSERIEPARSFHGEEVTDGDGRFVLPSLVEGLYELEVERGGKRALARRIWYAAGMGRARIYLHPVEHVRLTLRDYRDKPVELAMVTASQGFGYRVSVVSDSKGVAILEGLDPQQTYRLSIDTMTTQAPITRWARSEWEPANEVIRLPRGWRLRGVVAADGGDPPDEDTVLYLRVQGKLFGSVLDYHLVDDEGRFDVRGIPYGPVEVSVVPHDADFEKQTWNWTKLEPTDDVVKLKLERPKPRVK